MIFRRYDNTKRTAFVICSEENESDAVLNPENFEQTVIVLENKYREEILDPAPYHLIVTDHGVESYKSTDLAHADKSYLRAFNHDIKCLLTRDTLLSEKRVQIAESIAKHSAKYALPISGCVEYAKINISIQESEILKDIVCQAIKLRHDINPLLSIFEYVDTCGEVIKNHDIFPMLNSDGYTTLRLFADKYSCPVECLIELNPHIEPDKVRQKDIIFIPNTIAINGANMANVIRKRAQFIYDKSQIILSKGASIDG